MSTSKTKERKRDKVWGFFRELSRPSSPSLNDAQPASSGPANATSHLVGASASLSLLSPTPSPSSTLRPSTASADRLSAATGSVSTAPLPPDLSSTGPSSVLIVPQRPETLQLPAALDSPQPPSVPDTPQQPPTSDLWSQAFAKANEETQKWITKHGLQASVAQPRDQIKELISLVEGNKLSEQSEEPFKLEIGNQKIIVREYVADAVAFITMVGDAAIAFAPPQAGAPWAVAKAVMKIPVKHIEQKAALLGTVQWFTRIVRRGQIYEALYTTETTAEGPTLNLHDALLEIYIAVLELLAKSDALFESGVARQTLTAILRPDSATGAVKNLSEKEQRLDREVQSCEASRSFISSKQTMDGIDSLKKQLDQLSLPLPRIDKGIASLLSKVEKRELEKLMDFISSEMFGKSHATVNEARLDRTGEWLLASKEFLDWQKIPSSSAALCLKGTVGTGKTYLTSKVIDHVKETLKVSQHDEGFAFFYCNRSGSSMQDPMVILRSFVRQLAGKAFDETGRIQSSLIQRCEMAKREGRELVYRDCKELILESFNSYSKTTIILDALDESDISEYNLGAVLIELMGKSKRPVKLFISSRPDREYLEETFGNSRIITVDATSQQEDIERYLTAKLYSTSFFQGRNRDIQAKIREVFATKSRGMFRWVYLQVKSLQRCVTDDAIHSWSHKLPRNLTEAYDQLWERIQEHDASDVSLAQRAIIWVSVSLVPLKADTLLEAIRYDVQGSDVIRKEKQTQQQVLELCQDMLTIEVRREKRVWMLPHASVAEYVESKGWVKWKCHSFAAKVCLGFLLEFYPGRSEEGGSSEEPEESHKTGFTEYVKIRWDDHLQAYEKWLEGMHEEEADADLPSRMALFTICRNGLYHTLRDWWLGGKITREMALIQTIREENALELAVRGCVAICRHLIGLIFDAEHLDTERYAKTLQTAVQYDKPDVVNLLMTEVNIPLDLNSSLNGSASLAQHAAIAAPKTLRWFLDQDWIQLELENDSGSEYGNVLIAAAAWGNAESVRMLLEAGANVNAAVQNGHYGSALVAAAYCGWSKYMAPTVQLLLDNGADPNLVLNGGKYGSALEAAPAAPGANTKVLQMLLAAGADPAAVSGRGEHGSALAAAAFWGQKYLLMMMIDHVGKENAIEALCQSRCPQKECHVPC
ncbi:hypothetical protein BBK36DRAFT_1171668 [Trichoderma citrinoviride]|uniref:Nephrocystin 3-like N-terminal domain-containing protein n=1 Tax=Trichoderma citrinoviride TaxID=58853 RepID=A0A2T4B285_9HYPO|nr:hypothetical protein BBK36DRAFT_1171668 [Trichoderma citrinoviride]PTB63437.1 hypothetical protein BBK36DRAFT_1171668 [Trichoderma citrinoviride]